jgi:hypothetical protein
MCLGFWGWGFFGSGCRGIGEDANPTGLDRNVNKKKCDCAALRHGKDRDADGGNDEGPGSMSRRGTPLAVETRLPNSVKSDM